MSSGTVLVRRRALGDVVLLGAITGQVAGPVTVVTEARYAAVAARLPGVERVVAWHERGAVSGQVVDLDRSLRSVARFPFARRIRKHTLARRLRLWNVGSGRPAVTELYAEAAHARAVPPPWIALPSTGRAALTVLPGASTPLKRAPAWLLIAVARRWEGPVWVLGGPGEETLVASIVRAVPGAQGVAERGFARTWDVLAATAVAVGGDSGLLHLAAACGCPTVALAGPTHPDDGFLGGPRQTVIQRPLGCRPCTLHRGTRCRFGDRRCLDLDPENLWRAVQATLGYQSLPGPEDV